MARADERVIDMDCEVCGNAIFKGQPVFFDIDGEIYEGRERTHVRVRCAEHGDPSALGDLFGAIR